MFSKLFKDKITIWDIDKKRVENKDLLKSKIEKLKVYDLEFINVKFDGTSLIDCFLRNSFCAIKKLTITHGIMGIGVRLQQFNHE